MGKYVPAVRIGVLSAFLGRVQVKLASVPTKFVQGWLSRVIVKSFIVLVKDPVPVKVKVRV